MMNYNLIIIFLFIINLFYLLSTSELILFLIFNSLLTLFYKLFIMY